MNALLRLIVQRGLDRITVTDIANEANYGRWTFYQYFDSKEAVAWATFVYWMNQLDGYLVEAVQHLETPEREYASWRLIFEAFQQQKSFFSRLDSLIDSTWYFRAKEYLIQQFLGHVQAGRFTLMAGVQPEIAARLYVASIMELLVYWTRNPDLGTSEALVDQFFTFIFNQPPPTQK